MNRRFLLLVTMMVALLALASGTAAQESTPSAVESLPATETLSGTLDVIVGDSNYLDNPDATPIERFFLTTSDGATTELLIGPSARTLELYRLAGQEVIVTGATELSVQAAGTARPFVATGVRAASTAALDAPAVTGNTKWLSIGCKFADIADEPKPLSYFQNMYASTYPGLDHYWREASYNNINLVGSTAIAWVTLPKPMSAYQIDNQTIRWTDLFLDCAALVDAQVYFPDYVGVNLMLNGEPGCCAWGGQRTLTLDGVYRKWSVTWMPPWAYQDLAYLQHEMTHAYGILWHSYAGFNAYGDPWDVVSNAFAGCCSAGLHPVYGWVGQHTQAYHRYYLGWIPVERIVKLSGNGPHTVTLERATWPGSTGPLMAIVPIDGSSDHYYTIESRQLVGYDQSLPGHSITIHEIGGLPQPVQLMDPCASYSTWCKVWKVGDTWVAPAGGLTVRVDAATATGSTITIQGGYVTRTVALQPMADTYVDGASPNVNFGDSQVLRTRTGFPELPTARTTFVKFDRSLVPPLVVRAQLRTLVVEASTTGGWPRVTHALKDDCESFSFWDENTLTWSTFIEQWQWRYCYSLIEARSLPLQAGNWQAWPVEGILVWDTDHGNLGPISLRINNSSEGYASRESANPPQLVIDYLVVPTNAKTFIPTNDTYVVSSSLNGIYNRKTLNARNTAADMNAYVKFNVQGLSGSVQSAKLRLYAKDPGPDGGQVFATSPFYKGTTTQWLETGLKWKNAPLIGGSPVAAIGKTLANRWVEVDVTQAVIDGIANQNGRVSLAIANDSTNLVTYSSKEGARPPELVVVTAP